MLRPLPEACITNCLQRLFSACLTDYGACGSNLSSGYGSVAWKPAPPPTPASVAWKPVLPTTAAPVAGKPAPPTAPSAQLPGQNLYHDHNPSARCQPQRTLPEACTTDSGADCLLDEACPSTTAPVVEDPAGGYGSVAWKPGSTTPDHSADCREACTIVPSSRCLKVYHHRLRSVVADPIVGRTVRSSATDPTASSGDIAPIVRL